VVVGSTGKYRFVGLSTRMVGCDKIGDGGIVGSCRTAPRVALAVAPDPIEDRAGSRIAPKLGGIAEWNSIEGGVKVDKAPKRAARS
jgi:hypothetical protein